jgi:hypothetical protein
MSFATTPFKDEAEAPSGSVRSLWEGVRAHLENKRDRICAEITDHPRPVAGCDVHFNRLLEDRAKIFSALDRLADLRATRREDAQDIALIEGFISSCEAIDEKDRDRLRTASK